MEAVLKQIFYTSQVREEKIWENHKWSVLQKVII